MKDSRSGSSPVLQSGFPFLPSRVSRSVLVLLARLRRPGVVPGSGAIGRVPGGVVARCSRRTGRSRWHGARAARARRGACGLRVRSRGSGRCSPVVPPRRGPGACQCRASVRAGQWYRCWCPGGQRPGVPACRVAGRSRRRAARARTWTARCAGRRSARGGAGAGQVRFALFPAGSTPQWATSDAHEAEVVSSVVPGSGPILSVGALLQAATAVRRLLSAAGEPDAAECRACGDSRSPDLGSSAGGTAGCGGGAAGAAGGQGRGRPGRRRA